VLLLLAYGTFGTNFFYAHTITVEGTTYLRPQTVAAEAAQYLESHPRLGFISSRYFFTLPTQKLREALTSVRVQRIEIDRLPPGELRIRITENIPVANITAANRWYEVDVAGTVIGESFAPKPSGIKIALVDHIDPLVNGSEALPPEILSWLQSADALLPVDIPGMAALERNYFVDKNNLYSISVVMDAGWSLRLNRELPMDVQVTKLKAFYENRIASSKPWPGSLRYIDLRFSNTRVYYQE